MKFWRNIWLRQRFASAIFVVIAAIFLAIPQRADAQIVGKNYAQVNSPNSEGWDITAFYIGNNFHSCGAITVDSVAGMQEVVLEYVGADWQIGLNQGDGRNYQGRIFFLGSVRYTLSYEPVGPDAFQMIAPLGRSMVAELKSGNSFILEDRTGNQFDFSLAGSSAAMAKTEECFRNKGNKRATQRRQPQPRIAQNPTPRRNQPYPNAPKKTKLSGTWNWVNSAKNNRERNIISTIEITGPNTVRYCYGFPCWDANAKTETDNSVSFSIDNGISMIQFWDTGHNSISGRYWENFGTNNPPDATVNMR